MPDDNAAEDSQLDDDDEWDRELTRSDEFWRMIEERRREPTILWEEVKKELDLDGPT